MEIKTYVEKIYDLRKEVERLQSELKKEARHANNNYAVILLMEEERERLLRENERLSEYIHDLDTKDEEDVYAENAELRKEVERLKKEREYFVLRDVNAESHKVADLRSRLETAEARVREQEEKIHQLNIGKGTSITGQEADKLRERIRELEEKPHVQMADEYDRMRGRIKAMTEAGDRMAVYAWAGDSKAWDKAKGEAVPYKVLT